MIQVLAPVAPDMPAVRFHVLITVALGIEPFAEPHIVLIQEIGSSDGDEIQFRSLGKLAGKLRVKVGIDKSIVSLCLTVDGCRKQTYIIEQVGIVGRDVKRMESAHRQARSSSDS